MYRPKLGASMYKEGFHDQFYIRVQDQENLKIEQSYWLRVEIEQVYWSWTLVWNQHFIYYKYSMLKCDTISHIIYENMKFSLLQSLMNME